MIHKIAIRSEQDISPMVIDVLKAAKKVALGDELLEIEFIEPDEQTRLPVLALGVDDGDVRTLSPAQLVNKETAVSDLARAIRHVLNLPEHTELQYTVLKDYGPLDTLGQVVMFDIEVAGNIDTDLPRETPIISMAFHDGEKTLVVPEELCEGDPENIIVSILKSRTLVGHNMSFDMRTVSDRLNSGEQIYGDHDTMLMHFAMNHGAKLHGLKPLAQKWFNAPEWEVDLKKYTKGGGHYERIPRDILYQYNAYDVYWTGRLYREFRDQLENDPPRRALYQRLMQVSHMLQEVESGGVRIDVPLLEDIGARLVDGYTNSLEVLRLLTEDDNFNPGSWQQVKKYLHGKKVVVPDTNEKTLTVYRRDMEEESDPARFIDTLLEYRGLKKLHGTYVEGIIKRTREGILYPQYLVHGTSTGRLSSSNPNIQNIPRLAGDDDPHPIRKAIITRDEGHITASTDYSQIEMRALAELCGDEAMIDAFRPGGKDFFDLMMPGAYPDRFSNVEEFALYKKQNPSEAKNLRASVKAVAYGINYGRGARAVALQLDMPVEEAEAIRDGIFATYPGLKVWQEKVKQAIVDPDLAHMLITPFNRRFQAEVITHKNRHEIEKAAMAFMPQSTANDICLNAALEVHKRIGHYGGRLTGLVHDALYYDAPENTMPEVIAMVEREMVGSAAAVFHRVSFAVETETGGSWADV